ncbi:MAG: hypothetical protein AAF607_08115 [Pseudomonadota bacterium]
MKINLVAAGLSAFLAMTSAAHATVVISPTLPAGITLDFTNIPRTTSSGTVVDLNGNAAFQTALNNAGISSITATANTVDFDSRYDEDTEFDAGPALFGLNNGALIALDADETTSAAPAFAAPTFQIDFIGLVSEFGLRFADTSRSFATPSLSFFRNGVELDTVTITQTYTAETNFGFSLMGEDFDRVDVNTGTSDGVGIAALTVVPSAIPVPSAGILIAGALGGAALLRRRAAKRA